MAPQGAEDAIEHAARSLVAGRLVDLSLSGSTTPGAIQESFADGSRLLPAGVRVEASIDEVVVQPEGDAPVVASAGLARLEGPDTLVVSGLEGRLGDRPLPTLELRLTGLGHLLEAPSEPVGDVPPIPGVWALQEMLAPGDPEAAPLAWTSLEVEADWVLHPILLRPLYGLRVRMEPTPEGIALEMTEATWGGLPIRGNGVLETGTPGRAKLEITVDPVAEVRQKPASEAISRGHIVFERPPKPGLYAHTIRTGFDLSGSRLTLFDASGTMNVRGRIGGDAQLELGRDGEVGAAIRVFVTEAEVPDVLAALSDDPADSSGSIDIKARLDGTLLPGTSALRTLSGDLRVTASHGELGVDLPVLLAIAKASTTFNPFGSARGIRFDEIDAELELKDGQLSTRRSITLASPDLRLVLSGEVDLREKPNRLEAVVGCFFFQPLDRMIGLIPVVSRIVLGPDNSLFGTYFELTGSWESPKAGLIPMKTLALGPASFLLEDVPAFVQQGVAAVGEALSAGQPRTAGRSLSGRRRGRGQRLVKSARHKLVSKAEAARAVRRAQREGLRVVFTNGCFDLLHVGHVRSLEQARRLGDRLVVGVNSDASVRRIKGPSRPLVPARQRAEVLAALACVDLVVVFPEETPLRLIRALAPDVLAKGGDWALHSIVGREDVLARGGKVARLREIPGVRTTSLVDRILETIGKR